MARFGRAYPAPQRITIPPFRGLSPTVGLGSFSLGWEFPTVSVTTPSVTLNLSVFSLEWAFPAAIPSIGLGVFSLTWEWPLISAVVPVKPGDALTGAYGQVEWNGTLWGPGTNVAVKIPVEGWLGMPAVDNLNTARPSRHGAWAARKLAQQRIVTLQLQPDSAANPEQVDAAIAQIMAVTGIPEDDTELPLVIKSYGDPLLAYGQIIDRAIVMDGDYNAGLPTIGLVIACSDPRLYSLLRTGANIAPNSVGVLSNSGNTASHPLIRVYGPVVDPVLHNETTDRLLQFDVTLDEEDVLEVDADHGTISINGDTAMHTLSGPSNPPQDFVLIADTNRIGYWVLDGGELGADVLWRSATL